MNEKLKVFEIHTNGEKDMVCAYTNIHALQVHESITEIGVHDYDNIDFIEEVPEVEWDSIEITDPDNDNEVVCTLKEYMENAESVDIICTTAY